MTLICSLHQKYFNQWLNNLESIHDMLFIDSKLTLTGLAPQQHTQQILLKLEGVASNLQMSSLQAVRFVA